MEIRQDPCHLQPAKPKRIIGYYPAYKLNLKPGVDFNISPSINYLNYIAFGPNDLVNNDNNQNGVTTLLNNQFSRLNELKLYKTNNRLQFQIILSVLLPTDGNNLTQLFNGFTINVNDKKKRQGGQLTTNLASAVYQFGFDGIDIDYPFKLPCYPPLGGFNYAYVNLINGLSLQLSNKTLMITTGQYPTNIFNNISVDFINIQSFNLNVNSTTTNAGIDKIQQILNSWSTVINKSKLVFLGVEFGGIIKIVSSNNIKSDIENQLIQIANASNSMFPMANEPIPDQYYQSLNAKIDYINNNNNLAGIAIADITKDSNDSQLMNFIASGTQPTPAPGGPNATSPSTPTSEQPNPPNTGAIVGGVIGSLIFVGAIAGVGFMMYQKRKVKMSDLLKDTKNQTRSDINRQDYSDINRQVLGQDPCHLSPTKPPKIIIEYYPAYKLNLKPGIDFNISPSINYLNYIAFGPNDLVNNGNNQNGLPTLLNNQFVRFNELKAYRTNNRLQFKIILSVLLPTDGINLTQLFNVSGVGVQLTTNLVGAVYQFGFDGIDIDYPFKLPCYPLIGGFNTVYSNLLNGLSSQLSNKTLMITAGQYPINITNLNNIDFINIQSFNLNIKSNLILSVEFGGIIEIVSSNNIKSDIESQQIQIANATNSKLPMADEPIPDQ
ncbi:21860_t:CDS:10, partial [Gigaspora margarita]